MNGLKSALHLLADDGSGAPARADLADRALARSRQRGRRRSALALAGTAAVAVLVTVAVTTVSAGPARQAAVPAGHSRAVTSSAASSGFAKPRMNVLLIGSDAAPGRIGVRPDTIMVASIDTRTGDTILFGLPRSLQGAPFPPGTAQAAAWPHGFRCADQACLLNALWTWAEGDGAKYYRGSANPGLTATTQAAEQITGLTVDDSVVLNMRGLVQLVDAVGGVDVTVHERLPIGGSGDPNSPAYHKAVGGWIEKGRQHLDGYHALWFARSRWAGDDYDRMSRQRCLIGALVEQVDAGSLVTRYPQIAGILKANLTTTISPDQLGRWAALAQKTRHATLRTDGLSLPLPPEPDFARIHDEVAKQLAGGGSSKTAAGQVSGGRC